MDEQNMGMGRSLRGNVDRNIIRGDKSETRYESFPTWERG